MSLREETEGEEELVGARVEAETRVQRTEREDVADEEVEETGDHAHEKVEFVVTEKEGYSDQE